MSCAVTLNIDWTSIRPLKILVKIGIAKENCLLATIMDATLKVLGRMKPTYLLGNTNLHSQHERKAVK
jgi:hypothetical protein